MDSEAIAHLCATQKHHRYMMFGKKQRYIEVFQCSGDDMNMVLHGAQFQPPNTNISKPPLLSPGMLQPQPQTPQQAALSLPVSPNVPPLTLSIPPIPVSQSQSAALIQAQQAQFIAQQNLLARQQALSAAAAQAQQVQAQQNEQLLLQQLGYYTTPPPSNAPPSGPLSPTSATMNSLQLASQLPQMFYMPRGMLPPGLQMSSMGYMSGLGGIPGFGAFSYPGGMNTVVTGLPPTPAMSPISPTYSTAYTNSLVMSPSNQSIVTASASSGANTSRKRGYDSAFQNDPSNMNNNAKRQYNAPPPTPTQAQMQAQAAAATAAFYSQYYPPPM